MFSDFRGFMDGLRHFMLAGEAPCMIAGKEKGLSHGNKSHRVRFFDSENETCQDRWPAAIL